ncbi:MAG: patatin-like phospholipase family protein [Clostridiales bacterium]|nr:patatin-like phospholipase family protein [Clostridiales bacterium]
MSYNFRNYVFEGGGVKGLAYVGALKVLQAKGIDQQIERVAGASAGAICALLVALNYTSQEIQDILWDLDFNNFMDDDWGIIRDTNRLLEDYGWYKGDFFEKWIEGLIKQKTGSINTTFAYMKEKDAFKEVAFIGTNLSTHYSEIFSARTTPNMELSKALRITMSIPLFFKAVKMNYNKTYVDGGLLMNYPIKIFDRKHYVSKNLIEKDYYKLENEKIDSTKTPEDEYVFNTETLGFRLDSKNQISVLKDNASPKEYEIDDIFDYMWNLIETVVEAQQNVHLHSDDWHRTVYIDSLGIKTTEFDLSDKDKDALIASGEKFTLEYFNWYDNNQNTPLNKL